MSCCELNCVPSKFTCWSPNPQQPQNMTLFENRVIEVVISKDEVIVEQGSSWSNMTGVLQRGRIWTQKKIHTQEECLVSLKVEIRVMPLKAKECGTLSADHQKLWEKQETDSSSWPQKEEATLLTPWPLDSSLQKCETTHFHCVSQPVWGAFVWQCQEN